MVNFSKITASDLNNGLYKKEFPDLYNTKGLIENNPWHDNQDVFKHIIAVFESFKKLLSQKNHNLNKRFSQPVDKLTREDVLTLVVLFHDVGKKLVFIKSGDNTTNCPLHEIASSQIVLDNTKNLGLSKNETDIISFVVSLHGEISSVSEIYEKKKDKKILDLFSTKSKGWDAELTLFMLADLDGSDLKRLNHSFYSRRKKTLEEMLNYYL